MTVRDVVNSVLDEWSRPRTAFHFGVEIPFRLSCSIKRVPAAADLEAGLPAALAGFWNLGAEVRLFEDSEFGQWGLVLHDHVAAKGLTSAFLQDRSNDVQPGDVAVGEFLGDSDILIVRCDPNKEDFGRVLVALPLDARESWPVVAATLEAFLLRFTAEQGAKYWERPKDFFSERE